MKRIPETAQPVPETDEKKSRGLGSYVLWAFVAVMVYVLSSGPATLIINNSPRSGTASAVYHIFYYPLGWAYFRTPFHKPFGMYMHIWCPEHYRKNGDVWATEGHEF